MFCADCKIGKTADCSAVASAARLSSRSAFQLLRMSFAKEWRTTASWHRLHCSSPNSWIWVTQPGQPAIASSHDGWLIFLGNALASTLTQLFAGLCYATALLGGILADSYWGRYKTIVVNCSSPQSQLSPCFRRSSFGTSSAWSGLQWPPLESNTVTGPLGSPCSTWPSLALSQLVLVV